MGKIVYASLPASINKLIFEDVTYVNSLHTSSSKSSNKVNIINSKTNNQSSYVSSNLKNTNESISYNPGSSSGAANF